MTSTSASQSVAVLGTMMVALVVAVGLAVPYLLAALLCGLVAGVTAALFLHRVGKNTGALGLLVGLAAFGAFAIKRSYGLDDDLLISALVVGAYAVTLLVVGVGWRRQWGRVDSGDPTGSGEE
ncbi:MAG: hypothetical protein AAF899_05165 [Pseudomonadota bacterium]